MWAQPHFRPHPIIRQRSSALPLSHTLNPFTLPLHPPPSLGPTVQPFPPRRSPWTPWWLVTPTGLSWWGQGGEGVTLPAPETTTVVDSRSLHPPLTPLHVSSPSF